MPMCPEGHQSADAEFCDVCGLSLDGSKRTSPVAGLARCPECNARLKGRFCEECGNDSLPGAPPPVPPRAPAPDLHQPQAPTSWTATVNVDRAYFDAVTAAGGAEPADFPGTWQERRFLLRGDQVSIGRRSRSRGINPDIDLAGPPEDYGVSHLHAVLIPRQDSGWSIVDVGSTNGTMVNDHPYPLAANTPHPLADGDRIYVGAWTVITVSAEVPEPQ